MTKPANGSIPPELQFAGQPLPLLLVPPRESATVENQPREAQNPKQPTKGPTVGGALLLLLRRPHEYLIKKWNWKSAILSTILRSVLFFLTNLTAGLPAAFAAMTTEWFYRGITSGFYGALTEALSDVEPAWAGGLAVLVLLPIANHSVEFLVHWIRGTNRLFTSIGASVALTALSSLFNYYAMRKGTFIVGSGRKALLHDLAQFPRLTAEFCLFPVRWVRRRLKRLKSTNRNASDE